MNVYCKRRKRLRQLGLAALVLVVLGAGTAWAAPPEPYLFKDINTNTPGSYPSYLTNVNGTLFLNVHEEELWKSDGTEAGTVLIKRFYPPIHNLINVNDTLFFVADDGVHGHELWRSDGTEEGTVLVKDIRPGDASSYVIYLTNVNGTLFFSAFDSVHGEELWKSDGTAEGTVLVKDIRPGSSDSGLSILTNVNGTLFFSAYDGVHGIELWKSDGTEAGTVLVKDIYPGNANAYPLDMTNVNGTLFFGASDGVHGRELWKSDGTAEGTVLVKDIDPGSASSGLTSLTNVGNTLVGEAHNVLFFGASDGVHGYELWKSDGTAEGTVLVRDIRPGTVGFSYLRNLTNVNGTLFFNANDGVHGGELWKSDGTAEGTVLVKDIYPGSNDSYSFARMVDVNGTLFFQANDGVHGYEFWKSDGTEAGTVLVKDINPGTYDSAPGSPINMNGTLFFSADDGAHGRELYKSDGTEAGTVLVRDIYSESTVDSKPEGLVKVSGASSGEAHDVLFFRADDGVHGWELWKSDGTEAGTVLVKDINQSLTIDSIPTELTAVNGASLGQAHDVLFFSADDGVHGRELWVSDGTEAGTVLVKDINPGGDGSDLRSPRNMNDVLFFYADDGVHGLELWKSDGTEAGTVLVKDINPAESGISTWNKELVKVSLDQAHDVLFFRADDGIYGDELWMSDGTEAGTVLVKDIYPGDYDSSPYYLTNVNGTLFFIAWNYDIRGDELWKSDGTEAGTVLVKSFDPGPGYEYRYNLTNVNGTLFFSLYDSVHGIELWKSDGTEAGTVLVKDIKPGVDNSSPSSLINVNGTLFFHARGGSSGNWWKSDGTEAGTVPIMSINTNSWASGALFKVMNGLFFLISDDGVHGRELWVSDGTEAGTALVGDINPGWASSDPRYLAKVNDVYLFTADDGIHGEEVWALDASVDLELSQQVIASNTFLLPRDTVSYTLTYRNAGYYATAKDVVISAPLPEGLTQFSVSSNGAAITRTPGVTYTWQVEDLLPGEGGVISITAVIDPAFAGGVLSGTASISSTTTEANGENNSSATAVTVQPPALRVFKSVQGPGGATTNLWPGDVVTYSVALDNSLNELAAGVALTDPLPADVRFGGWVQQGSAQLPPPSGTGTLDAEVIGWGPWGIPAGGEVSVVFTATVAPGSAWLGNPVVNTAWFSSINAGSGSASAVFSVKVVDIFLPLLMRQ